MAEVDVSDLVEKITGLASQSLSGHDEITLYLGGRSKLEALKETMKQVQARLEQQQLDIEWLRKLSPVVYQLDNWRQKAADVSAQQKCGKFPGGKLFNVLCAMPTLSHEAKHIKKKLRQIMLEMQPALELPVEERVESSLSDSSGHDDDDDQQLSFEEAKTKIMQLLLADDHDVNSDVESTISVIPVVGMRGIGKTRLAKLVFDNLDVKECFELRAWVSVSQRDSHLDDLKQEILTSMTGSSRTGKTLEEVVMGNKFLLVLDDVWDALLLDALKALLSSARRGSRIMVTTRSPMIAQTVGTVEALAPEMTNNEAWELFEKTASEQGRIHPDLTIIGKDIVKCCKNFPQTLIAIANTLRHKDTEEEWMTVRQFVSSISGPAPFYVISEVKVGYNDLRQHLKQCFNYCTLLPNDREVSKVDLIPLWMAQGFITPSPDTSLWDAGDKYFMELLRRSFFLNGKEIIDGAPMSCNFDDLMLKLARHLAEAEDGCLMVNNLDDGQQSHQTAIRHLSFIVDESWETPSWLSTTKQLQSLLLLRKSPHGNVHLSLDAIFSSLKSLRVLNLEAVFCADISDSLAELKLLSYLRLGVTLGMLPRCIMKLPSLETLDLRESRVKELPKDFNKLIKLRHLYIGDTLVHLLPEFRQLKSLRRLYMYVVGEHDEIKAIGSSDNPDGKLKFFYNKATNEADMRQQSQYLLIALPSVTAEPSEFLRTSFPPLESLVVTCPQRVKLSVRISQCTMDTLLSWRLPNIVSLEIAGCCGIKHLPEYGRFPCLKNLQLWKLKDLEYVVEANDITHDGGQSSSDAPYFATLECLGLYELHELKGWSAADNKIFNRPSFPRLVDLRISGCPKLMSLPSMIKSLAEPSSSAQPLEDGSGSNLKDTSVALPRLSSLEKLLIEKCEALEWGNGELCQDPNSDDEHNEGTTITRGHKATSPAWQGLKNLRSLTLRDMNLKSFPSAICHLTTLQELYLSWLYNLRDLPETIGQLRQLQQLHIWNCHKLAALPKSLASLTNLQHLRLEECPKLRRRCKRPSGDLLPLFNDVTTVVNFC